MSPRLNPRIILLIFFSGASLNKKSGEIIVNSSFKAEEWGIDWIIHCFADVPHLGKAIKNALNNQKQIFIDKNYLEGPYPEYLRANGYTVLPTIVVDVAAIRAVINYDKTSELKLAPHLPKEALDLGNSINNLDFMKKTV